MSGLTCQDARNLFDAHLNGELSAAMETELNAHRIQCPSCRHELALLEVAGDVIAADDAVPALNDEFTSRLLACVAECPSPKRFQKRRLVRIGAQALAAAACLMFAVVHFSGPKPQVDGFRYEAPRIALSQDASDVSDSSAKVEEAVPAQPSFQNQLAEALTDLRNDASSLKKVYRFITLQIDEETRLEQPENGYDQPNLFEPAMPETLPEGSIVPYQIIEDI